MKSIRLTKDTRMAILNSMCEGFTENYFKKTVYKDLEAMKTAKRYAEESALKKLWFETYGRHQEVLSKLPTFLHSSKAFKVMSHTGYTKELPAQGFPGKNTPGVDVVLDDDVFEAAFKESRDIQKEMETFNKELNAFKREVNEVLQSVNTTKQLLEIWPSAEAYIPAHIQDPDKGMRLPALHISRLEERLNGGAQ